MTTVREVITALEERYPPALAANWDAIGLVCGRLDAPVSSVLFAVDPVFAVVREAHDVGANLIVAHHPLFLHGVNSVAADSAGGRVVHELIEQGIALFTAHTNADHASPGVSDALAERLGLIDVRPIDPISGNSDCGTGRAGRLEQPMSLGAFADLMLTALPKTSAGITVAGDLDARIESVGVCGGAGDSLLPLVHDLDVYVTSDLRHHRAQEHREHSDRALINVPHWSSEWPWLQVAADQLHKDLLMQGSTVDIYVSTIVTDPWTWHTGG